jgi:hypothetical protein
VTKESGCDGAFGREHEPEEAKHGHGKKRVEKVREDCGAEGGVGDYIEHGSPPLLIGKSDVFSLTLPYAE